VIALGLSLVTLLCLIGVLIVSRRRVRLAYVRGYSAAGVVLFGVVAAELGPDAPLLDRMLARFGERAPDDMRRWRVRRD
jgi:O-antigen ligase